MGRLGPPAAQRDFGRGLPAISGSGGPQDAAPRASFTPRAREGQAAAMKWARINEIWYEVPPGHRSSRKRPEQSWR